MILIYIDIDTDINLSLTISIPSIQARLKFRDASDSFTSVDHRSQNVWSARDFFLPDDNLEKSEAVMKPRDGWLTVCCSCGSCHRVDLAADDSLFRRIRFRFRFRFLLRRQGQLDLDLGLLVGLFHDCGAQLLIGHLVTKIWITGSSSYD